jgi:hypothetical protein
MSTVVVMDEFHVQVIVPAALPATARAAVRRHLRGPALGRRVVRAVAAQLAEPPAPAVARARLVR